MDAAALLTLLALALALALQPWSIIAAVLLVASRDGTRRACAFVLGWFLALAVIAYATAVLTPPGQTSTSTSTALGCLDLVVGLLLAGWLFVRHRRTPADRPTAETPKWMARIDTMPTFVAFLLGGFLPSYVFVVAAVSQMIQSGLSGGGLAAVATVFVLVASLGVAAPLAVVVLRRDRASEIHEHWRHWLVENSSLITTWIVAVIAVVLIVKGTVGLFV